MCDMVKPPLDDIIEKKSAKGCLPDFFQKTNFILSKYIITKTECLI